MKRNLWIFKYQPKTLQEMILDPDTRKDLETIKKELPNFILSSRPGMGKGTFVEIFINDTIGRENILWLNGSDENSIDVMRSKVKDFSRSLGFGGDFKYVIINEADRLSPAAQDQLREEVERVNNICGFVFMINEKERIIDAHFSRFWWVEYNNPPKIDVYNYCVNILNKEKIVVTSTTKKNLVELIRKLYPDIRKIVNALQFNIRDGKLNSSFATKTEELNEVILTMMIKKSIEELRKTLKSNYIDYQDLYNFLYENVGKFNSPGDGIILIGEHLFRDSKVAIKEINFMHMYFQMLKNKVI